MNFAGASGHPTFCAFLRVLHNNLQECGLREVHLRCYGLPDGVCQRQMRFLEQHYCCAVPGEGLVSECIDLRRQQTLVL